MNTLFEHDCDNCQFLGQHTNIHGTYDLYICPNEPTIVARWGNHGSEYHSGIEFVDRNSALAAAWEAARNQDRERLPKAVADAIDQMETAHAAGR